MQNTNLILQIVAMLIKADSPPQAPPVVDGSGCPVVINEPIQQYEQGCVGATLMDDNPYDPQPPVSGYPVAPPGFSPPPERNQPQQGTVIKLASPDLGVAIPMEWLDPVDALYDALKDNAAAVASLDAMLLNWLKIKRYEPKPGDKFVSSNDQTVGGEIGFVIERLIKRGYEYVGTANGCLSSYGNYYGRGYGKMRKSVVKLANGLTPPTETATVDNSAPVTIAIAVPLEAKHEAAAVSAVLTQDDGM